MDAGPLRGPRRAYRRMDLLDLKRLSKTRKKLNFEILLNKYLLLITRAHAQLSVTIAPTKR